MRRSLPSLALTLLVAIGFSCAALAQAPAPASPAEQAAAQALELFNSGKNKEAADAYAAILKNFPTASVVSDAQFHLAYIQYLNGDYDHAAEGLKKVSVPP